MTGTITVTHTDSSTTVYKLDAKHPVTAVKNLKAIFTVRTGDTVAIAMSNLPVGPFVIEGTPTTSKLR
jgi:uncharacterized protein YjdB